MIAFLEAVNSRHVCLELKNAYKNVKFCTCKLDLLETKGSMFTGFEIQVPGSILLPPTSFQKVSSRDQTKRAFKCLWNCHKFMTSKPSLFSLHISASFEDDD